MDNLPNNLQINSKILIYQQVSEILNILPSYISPFFSYFLGYFAYSLSDNFKFPYYC